MLSHGTAKKGALSLTIALAVAGVCASAEYTQITGGQRTWNDNTGQYSLRGKLIGIDIESKAVRLEDANGRQVTTPFSRLGTEDLSYVKLIWQAKEQHSHEDTVKSLHIRLLEDGEFHLMDVFNRATDIDLAELELARQDSGHEFRRWRMTRLELNRSRVSNQGLHFLRSYPELEVLYLRETAITDEALDHLKPLVNVKLLCLDGTKITDRGLTHLRSVKELKELSLANTEVQGSGLAELQGLSELELLRLNRARVTDDGVAAIAQLDQLTELGLSENAITDASVKHLAKMTNLKYLVIRKTGLTQTGINQLKSALRDCEIVDD